MDDRLRIDAALRQFDNVSVEQLCRRYVRHVERTEGPIDLADGLDLAKKLQRKRHIQRVQDVTEALLTHADDSVAVRHRYALALLDDGRLAAAEALLLSIPLHARKQDPEVLGAIGRLHKQRYLAAPGRRGSTDITAAIRVYAHAYRADPEHRYYHGINAAALLLRASRDAVAVPGHPDPEAEARQIAERLLLRIDRQTSRDMWEMATAAEACLVLDRQKLAVDWLVRYVGSEADAFEFASTLRQFQDVWQLDPSHSPGLQIIPLLRERLLQAEGGTLDVREQDVNLPAMSRLRRAEYATPSRPDSGLERVYGWARFQPIAWLREALTICSSISRVEDRYGNGVGTAFVVDGQALRPDWPERVLLTNAHVVPDAVQADDAWVTFRAGNAAGKDMRLHPGRILWVSGRKALDACFLELPDGAPESAIPLRVRRSFPVLGAEHEVRAYVVGHPQGSQEVQLSLHNSLLLHAGDVYAHYRSPTEHGSSGSPVFDDQWRVIALHHSWVDTLPGQEGVDPTPANEGIRFDTLAAAVLAGDGAG